MSEASHVPKFPGDYESAGSTAFIFHLSLFAEHAQLTVLTQEVSLQTSLNSVRHLVWISCARSHPPSPNHTVSSFFSGSLYFVLTLPRRAFHPVVTPLHGVLGSAGGGQTAKSSRAFPSWAARTQLRNWTFLLAGGLESCRCPDQNVKNPHVPAAGQCEDRDMAGNNKQKSPLVTDFFHLESKFLGFLGMPWPNSIALNLFSHDSSSGNKGNGNEISHYFH